MKKEEEGRRSHTERDLLVFWEERISTDRPTPATWRLIS
jgi:hypothetical protein